MDTETHPDNSTVSAEQPAETTTAPATAVDDTASRELTSALDYDTFVEIEAARTRRNALLLRLGIVIAVIGLPIGFLALNGNLSTKHLYGGDQSAVAGKPRALGLGKPGAHASPRGLLADTALTNWHPPTPSPAEAAHRRAVAADLHSFVYDGVKRVTPEELAALQQFESVTGKQFKDNATTYKALRSQVIPRYSKFVQDVSQLHPTTPEVRKARESLLASVQLRLLSYQHMLDGETAKDNTWHYTVAAELKASEAAALQFQSEVEDLAQRYDVKLPP